MIQNPNVVVRKVYPATFLVDITRCYNDKSESLVEIDEMGLAIWTCVSGNMSKDQIVQCFLNMLTDEKTDEFIAEVTTDVNSFLDALVAQNCLLEEV